MATDHAPEINDEDSITVFENKLAAFAKAAKELDNAWDYVDGDPRVIKSLPVDWPFQEQLYYTALGDTIKWANKTIENLNKL